jgi:hypothetical protein
MQLQLCEERLAGELYDDLIQSYSQFAAQSGIIYHSEPDAIPPFWKTGSMQILRQEWKNFRF